jgi:hypothetical protein
MVMTQVNGNQFLPAELIKMRHYDKKSGKWSESEYPKVGGRLRLAHELNGTLDISTEIIQYDGNVAVVKALCSTDKGSYTGISMASLERDAKIAPAILELAETRAIARSLRFAGYGVEYCSAEEVSHLDHENDKPSLPPIENDPFSPDPEDTLYCPSSPANMQFSGGGGGDGGITDSNDANGNGGNGTGRLSSKQYNYLLSLASNKGLTKQDVDKQAIANYGAAVSFLNKHDASSMIEQMIN